MTTVLRFTLSLVQKSAALAALMIMPIVLQAQELGLDIGVATSTISEGGGYAVHGQLLYNNNLGYDFGYRYQDRLQYSIDGDGLSHAFSQYELGVFWQEGREAARFQVHAGVILAGNTIETASEERVVTAFTPGYRLDADLSLPFVDRLRVFTSLGYQGYYQGDMPSHWRWRYGLRMTFGGQRASGLERVRLARIQAEQRAEREAEARDSTGVPATLPLQLSQSLPPIVTYSEVCKCFPAGPYTLQLGEFRSMEQAVRALEFRGLRQFFTSIPYERSPQAVFLAQPQAEGPVAFFLGEFNSLADTESWRRELRRHGLEGRVRRVVGSEGRIANRVRSVDDPLAPEAGYTEEQIARMNRLSESQQVPPVSRDHSEVGESTPLMPALTSPRLELEAEPAPVFSGSSLLVGPLSEVAMQEWLGDPDFMRQWLVPEATAPSTRMRLVWDANAEQGWYVLDQFGTDLAQQQALRWLEDRGLTVTEQPLAWVPSGDIYQYRLGHSQTSPFFNVTTEARAESIWQRLLSPEMLWFQAFQAINDRPAEVLLNASADATGYQLIATGFGRQSEAEAAWRHLVSVGLLPERVQ